MRKLSSFKVGKAVIAVVMAIALTTPLMPLKVSALTVEAITTQVISSNTHTMVIKSDGSLWGWGDNDNNQVGIGLSSEYQQTPMKIMDNVKSISIASSDFREGFSLAIKTDNSLWGFGNNSWGQLGNAVTDKIQSTPAKIMDNIVTAIACGGFGSNYTLAIDKDYSLYKIGGAWKTWQKSSIPLKIADNVLYATNDLSYILKTDGNVYKEVDGVFSQLIMSDVVQIDGNINELYALKSDGSLWIHGNTYYNYDNAGTPNYYDAFNENYGQVEKMLWNYTFSTSYKIADDVIAISKGYSGAVHVIKSDNALWEISENPKWIADNVVAIDCSISPNAINVLFVKADGMLWGYGSNRFCQLRPEGGNDIEIPLPIIPDIFNAVPINNSNEETVKVEKPSAWAEEQVNEAITLNLVPQSLQTKYTEATTRAEFCALAVTLYETMTGIEITERKIFNDTKDENVEKMAGLGVVSGVGNNDFAPDDKLTREQAAVMLSRLAEITGNPFLKHESAFSDNSNISAWAIESVGQVQGSGIMSGTGDNQFSPKELYTREQSIVTILRMYMFIEKGGGISHSNDLI